MKLKLIPLDAPAEGFALVADEGFVAGMPRARAEAVLRQVNFALGLAQRQASARDRTNIPPHVQDNPDAKSWHWNEHPQGKFSKEKE